MRRLNRIAYAADANKAWAVIGDAASRLGIYVYYGATILCKDEHESCGLPSISKTGSEMRHGPVGVLMPDTTYRENPVDRLGMYITPQILHYALRPDVGIARKRVCSTAGGVWTSDLVWPHLHAHSGSPRRMGMQAATPASSPLRYSAASLLTLDISPGTVGTARIQTATCMQKAAR